MTETLLERSRSDHACTTLVEPKLDRGSLPSIDSLEERVVRFQETRSRDLYNQIAAELLPDLACIARRLHARGGFPKFIDQDDLVQYGAVGLIRAIESYDGSRGVLFRTFAARRIEGAMLDGLRAEDPMTREERQRQREIKRSIERLATAGVACPLEEEIRAGTSLSVEEFWESRRLMRAQVRISLDRPLGGEQGGAGRGASSEGPSNGETIPDHRTPEVEAVAIEAEMWDAIGAQLNERERRVIEGYLKDGREPRDIAQELGVSGSLVAYIKLSALQKLRSAVLRGELAPTLLENQ